MRHCLCLYSVMNSRKDRESTRDTKTDTFLCFFINNYKIDHTACYQAAKTCNSQCWSKTILTIIGVKYTDKPSGKQKTDRCWGQIQCSVVYCNMSCTKKIPSQCRYNCKQSATEKTHGYQARVENRRVVNGKYKASYSNQYCFKTKQCCTACSWNIFEDYVRKPPHHCSTKAVTDSKH